MTGKSPIVNDNLKDMNWMFLYVNNDVKNEQVPEVSYEYDIVMYDFVNVANEKRSEGYNLNVPIDTLTIKFQLGNFQTENTNGILDEFLLTILEHRLTGFQASEFSCVENEKALEHIKSALMWMLARKNNRKQQAVLDTYNKHKS